MRLLSHRSLRKRNKLMRPLFSRGASFAYLFRGNPQGTQNETLEDGPIFSARIEHRRN